MTEAAGAPEPEGRRGGSPPAARTPSRSGRNAALVAAGIFLSRIAGFVRERVFAHYLGNSAAADAFRAALRIPNLLQNLFGEAALSASFIPVYARLLSDGQEEEARRVARAVGSLLLAATTALVALGILATPLLIDLIAPGFTGEKRDATIGMVRLLFPGIGLLVLSAWCLGILNSHRRFFLPYAAPVIWNGAIIATLLVFGVRGGGYELARWAAWGAVAGSALQLAVQLPAVLRLAGPLRFSPSLASAHVRTVLASFVPSLGSRGVVQISSYVDQVLASFLPTGAVAALGYAQTLYLLPVGLFGMSISAAELPEMSGEADPGALRQRLDAALRRVAFLVVPTVVAFVALGDRVVALVFQTGRFGADDVSWVWAVLAAYSVGLLASTLGRLSSSAFWALRDTRTPFRFAVVRVVLAAAVGWALAYPVPRALGAPARWGLAGLALGATVAGVTEYVLLRRALARRIGPTRLPRRFVLSVWGAALVAGAAGWGAKLAVAGWRPELAGCAVLGVFAVVYGGLAVAAGVPEARGLLSRLPRLHRR